MKKFLGALVALGLLASLGQVSYADVAASALPSLNNATNADVTIGNSNNMNIQIQGGQGGVGTLNWNSFNVGKDASVNYEFSAHNQTALNKVSATGGLSQIYGKITSSGCAGCGYDATGKVILINPNGVLFGDGANVNLNSFTVSTFDGAFDKETNTLTFDRNGKTSDYGILVMEGAQIHGDKAVNLISDNVAQYAGSKITTNIGPNANGNTASLGKVKIVTADGVNFAYYNNGAVKGIDGVKTSADKMTIALNGDITAGNIDVRNYSNNADSQINLNGATLKAVKQKYPEYKTYCIFQSHTYSRTLKFKKEFKKVLQLVDVVYIRDVFSSSREKVNIKKQKRINKYFNSFKKYHCSIFDNIDYHNKNVIMIIGATPSDEVINDIKRKKR